MWRQAVHNLRARGSFGVHQAGGKYQKIERLLIEGISFRDVP